MPENCEEQRSESEAALVNDYPKLFAGVKKPMATSCMAYGMEIGLGWHGLVRQMSEELKDLDVQYAQVKEKFGVLRVYLDQGPDLTSADYDKAQAAVEKYEALSATTCETCGKPGSLVVVNGWSSTLCPEHHEQRKRD